ncbi:MAG: peptidase, partial [Planctomycetes bacterium]|nr:peptidase [Planctomycetota bacterium]
TAILTLPRKKLQPNRQISESVLIQITIDPLTQPGNRELRIVTAAGMTNPMVFNVGQLTEFNELEPNNKAASPALQQLILPRDEPVDLPILINGQIMPGDIDCFRFNAEQGQKLVIEARARSLIPYLADAVPGWFQATLTLYNTSGDEIAFADDYNFHPDPVLFYQVPESGEYTLEIRDAIYRGRHDFIYRISIGDLPYVTSMFPLGTQSGTKTVATIDGWNLSQKQLTLDPGNQQQGILYTTENSDSKLSNPIAFSVDTLPEQTETESNNTIKDAQYVKLPITINGRIIQPGDIDVFQFNAQAGDNISAELYGRRLNSPLDSLLRLTDSSG